MNVTFELLGVLQRLCGSERIQLQVHAATVADALEQLALARPDLRGELERCAIASGDAIVRRRDALSPGAVLALLPPVAGG
ncbi:MAG TPA: MoaD/ThiS family protein [Nevskiaceae bacterium]|nr:MoaD/ThiS family protein [Nevskiaceae bacterium]